jgi:predicted amidohydrolase YtcJ
MINLPPHPTRKSTTCMALLAMTVLCLRCSTNHVNADTVLINGRIITVDRNFSVAEAVAIRDGRIIATGDTETILDLKDDSTEVIDLRGHAVIPGLDEGHGHPIGASLSELVEPIPDVHTIADVLHWIAQEAARKKKGEWIIHPKFFITRLSDMRQMTKRELDSVAPDNPVFLNGSYGGLINSKAIAVSGLNRRKHPGILRDAKTQEPSGLIRRSAFGLLALPERRSFTAIEKYDALKALFHRYNSIGITSVCSGGGTQEELKTFEALKANGDLSVRVFHNIIVPFDMNLSVAEMRDALKRMGVKTGDGDEWVKVGALKVVLDGGMLTGTAFLNEPWGRNARDIYGINDPNYRGELFYSKNQLINLITAGAEAGWKLTAHVTGGGGVDTLLAAYEAVNASIPIRDRRFSIIHGNFYSADAINKMAAMNIYADMQPAWFFKDTDLLSKVLGSKRITTFHPYRALIDAGIVINGGSDHMVKVDPNTSINPYNPFIAMWSVVTRKTEKGMVFNPEQAISRAEALKMYTINNALASFEEDVKGSIEQGKFADLVVLSNDILTCPADSIKEITPLLTMVNGKKVFQALSDNH